MKKDTAYTIRLNSGLKTALEAEARRDSRSLASLMQKALKDYLEVRGIEWEETMPDKPKPKKRGTRKK